MTRGRAPRLTCLLTAAAMTVAGCSETAGTSAASSSTTGSTVDGSGPRLYRDESWGFPLCEDVPDLAAPPEAYRDEPVYDWDEAPIDEVEAWAKDQPGYGGILIDYKRNGWITVAFTQDAEVRQRDLEEEFAGVGVVAVPVGRTTAELDALVDRVDKELPPLLESHGFDAHMAGVFMHKWTVFLTSVVLTEDLRGEIERRFSGEPLCVDGLDPATVPPLGPQPSGGDGWLLLSEGRGLDGPGRISLVTDAASFAERWASRDAPVPEVDFEKNVVIAFVAVVSSSCPDVRLDDVVAEGFVVRAKLVDPVPQFECTEDAVPHSFVVALERSRLRSGPFTIELPDHWWSSGGELAERLMVDADLSEPGAVAEAGAVRPEASVAKPERSGMFIEPEFPWPYRLDARCGIEWLGEVNNVVWRTDEAMPEEWEEHVDEVGGLVVAITMRVGPEPLIEAELGGETVVYEPSPGEIPECDQP